MVYIHNVGMPGAPEWAKVVETLSACNAYEMSYSRLWDKLPEIGVGLLLQSGVRAAATV